MPGTVGHVGKRKEKTYGMLYETKKLPKYLLSENVGGCRARFSIEFRKKKKWYNLPINKNITL